VRLEFFPFEYFDDRRNRWRPAPFKARREVIETYARHRIVGETEIRARGRCREALFDVWLAQYQTSHRRNSAVSVDLVPSSSCVLGADGAIPALGRRYTPGTDARLSAG
jgi:hypothetical protein